MAFRFSLAGILRFRRSVEHHQELQLLAANQKVAQVRQRMVEVDRGATASWMRQAQLLRNGLSAAEIHFELQCRATLGQRRQELEQELLCQEKIRDERRLAYQAARKSREMVDTLCERQFQLYRQQQVREDQRQLDDLFLLGRRRRS